MCNFHRSPTGSPSSSSKRTVSSRKGEANHKSSTGRGWEKRAQNPESPSSRTVCHRFVACATFARWILFVSARFPRRHADGAGKANPICHCICICFHCGPGTDAGRLQPEGQKPHKRCKLVQKGESSWSTTSSSSWCASFVRPTLRSASRGPLEEAFKKAAAPAAAAASKHYSLPALHKLVSNCKNNSTSRRVPPVVCRARRNV